MSFLFILFGDRFNNDIIWIWILIVYICIWYEKVVQIPWVYADTDDGTPNGNPKLDDNGNPMFTGYCMEFLHEMSKLLNFDYDVIPPTDNCRCFGEKQEDGTWTGLIGKMQFNINFCGFTDKNLICSRF